METTPATACGPSESVATIKRKQRSPSMVGGLGGTHLSCARRAAGDSDHPRGAVLEPAPECKAAGLPSVPTCFSKPAKGAREQHPKAKPGGLCLSSHGALALRDMVQFGGQPRA